MPVRVLSIDGGGIRGLIPALVLEELERRCGRPVSALFDLMVGTSTGGILVLALAAPAADGVTPRMPASLLPELYDREGPGIFSRSLLKTVLSGDGWLDERYEPDGLKEALTRYLGATRLSAALTPVVVTAYDIEAREAFFLKSRRARERADDDGLMRDAALATAAAPTYFPPAEVFDRALVDGGVYAANPAMCAYAEARAHHGEPAVLLSLGTGRASRPLPREQVRGWGRLEWARPIVDVILDAGDDTVDYQLRQVMPGPGYRRLQVELTEASGALDDASPANLRALRREGERLLREHGAELDAVCAMLDP